MTENKTNLKFGSRPLDKERVATEGEKKQKQWCCFRTWAKRVGNNKQTNTGQTQSISRFIWTNSVVISTTQLWRVVRSLLWQLVSWWMQSRWTEKIHEFWRIHSGHTRITSEQSGSLADGRIRFSRKSWSEKSDDLVRYCTVLYQLLWFNAQIRKTRSKVRDSSLCAASTVDNKALCSRDNTNRYV